MLGHPRGSERPEQAADGADPHDEAEACGRQLEFAQDEDGLEGADEHPEQVGGAGGEGDAPQHRVAEHEPQPLGDLATKALSLSCRAQGLGVTHPRQRERGAEEGDRVGDQQHRCGEDGQEQTGQTGATDAADLARGLQQRVAGAHERPREQNGHEALIRDIEEHRCDADHRGDDDQMPDLERAREPQHRHRREEQRTNEVGGDHHAALAHAVDPRAGGQPHDEERRRLSRRQNADLELGGVQQRDSDDGDRELRELGAELTDRVPAPEPEEVAIAQQEAAWGVGRGIRGGHG